jgi:hypothetical protein
VGDFFAFGGYGVNIYLPVAPDVFVRFHNLVILEVVNAFGVVIYALGGRTHNGGAIPVKKTLLVSAPPNRPPIAVNTKRVNVEAVPPPPGRYILNIFTISPEIGTPCGSLVVKFGEIAG